MIYKQITHQVDKQRFVYEAEGHLAYLLYQVIGDRIDYDCIDYNHTIVPNELGGRGLGTELVKFALAYARVNYLSVIPSCSFVAHYIQKNSSEQDLLVK